jgi:8-oxo-dGTP diphosphatase
MKMVSKEKNMSYNYKYPHPALTVDCVVFSTDNQDKLEILLIKRKNEPYQGMWALPGGFVEIDEELEQAASRELEEETGIKGVSLEQVYAFGAVDRDPRERNIAVAYMAIVNKSKIKKVKAADDAADANWFAVDECPKLAFDHHDIIVKALEKLNK